MSKRPDEHVVDLVVEYFAGELDQADRVRVKRHLDSCTDCAADFAMAAAIAEGPGHLPADRMAELSNPNALPTDSETAHLERCTRCRHSLSKLQESMPLAGLAGDRNIGARSHRPHTVRRNSSPRRSIVSMLTPLVVAAAVLVLFFQPWKNTDLAELSSLASLEALPPPARTEAGLADRFAELRLRGFELYQDEDWDGAAAQFREALRLRAGDGELRLYLASTHLMLRDGRSAEGVLHVGAGLNSLPAELHNDALWLLTNAYLLNNDAAAARRALGELSAHESPLRPPARALQRKLD